MKIVVGFICLLMITSCKVDRGHITRKVSGFIVYDDPDFWRFIPARSVNFQNCSDAFKTENLLTGVSFSAKDLSKYSFIVRTFDTLSVEDLGPGYPENRYSLKISPVTLTYQIPSKFAEFEDESTSCFRAKVKGRMVEFRYNLIPIVPISITPLFCLSKKSDDIVECRCSKDPEDPNDYLYRLCEYMKANDRYSILACSYRIKSVSTDTLDGKKVTKVSLSCCYGGDVAYFDPVNLNIVDFYYSAK